MSNALFTSDTHFGHSKILSLGNGRPFDTIEEHDETIIERWNAVVKPGDRVFHNGDGSFRDAEQTVEIFRRLNGQIFYQRGNHCRRTVMKALEGLNNVVSIEDYREVKINGQKIILSHYPFLTWNGSYRGSWMLHGHCHGNLAPDNNTRLDVGVDTHDFTPWSFDEIAEVMKTRAYEAVDHHMSEEQRTEQAQIVLLRAYGCKCSKPLLGERPGVGPRCRLCNTEAKWESIELTK